VTTCEAQHISRISARRAYPEALLPRTWLIHDSRGAVVDMGLDMPIDLFFSWVTPLVRRGAADPLSYDDLLSVPHDTTPKATTAALWQHWTQVGGCTDQPVQCQQLHINDLQFGRFG